MSLVDELLADFSPSPSPSQSRSASPEPENDRQDEELVDANSIAEENGFKDGPGNDQASERTGVLAELETTARLLDQLNPLLDEIDKYTANPDSAGGSVEDNPEYKLLVSVTNIAADITTEIVALYKYTVENYNPRFPELESLVLNPVEYARTVKAVGNNVEQIKDMRTTLAEFLPAAIIMVLTVSAVTSKSRPLTDEELARVQESSDVLLFLDSANKKITQYVSSKLSVFAPNTSALVGSTTAAQLVGAVGGLNGLSKMPSCNMPSLGVRRNQTNIGLGNTGIRQQGFLYFSPVIQKLPLDLRKQGLRILSGKVALMARIDLARSHTDGSAGNKMRVEVEEKLDKLGVPPSNKGPKALPAPDDKPSKKRGGRRLRKYKQQFAMTDVRKAQNRMRFGDQDGDYI
ncbi:hypothetical protein BZA70DRAFT_283609 [Myxozyma melibiosi]|uniref:Nop domain-containing protein n=1 Tax=Myxozyma melibiosi TaxID=54550 RepID=A0ABR1F0L4_9ASCO